MKVAGTGCKAGMRREFFPSANEIDNGKERTGGDGAGFVGQRRRLWPMVMRRIGQPHLAYRSYLSTTHSLTLKSKHQMHMLLDLSILKELSSSAGFCSHRAAQFHFNIKLITHRATDPATRHFHATRRSYQGCLSRTANRWRNQRTSKSLKMESL